MPTDNDNVVEVALIDASNKSKEQSVSASKHSFFDLFRYASRWDKLLIVLGSIVAVGTGGGIPLLSILLGQVAQSFIDGQRAISSANRTVAFMNETPTSDFMADLNTYCLYYLLLSCAQFFTAGLQVVCWLTVSENLIIRIRRAFFRAVLRQDIAWFDQNASGELTTKLFDNIERIREGSGDKVGLLLQFISQFISGFTVAFCYNWKLTLIVMSLLPFLVLSGIFLSRLAALTSAKEVGQYSKAGMIAQDAVSCIRTVIAFNGESKECQRYKSALKVGMKLGIRKALYIGIGLCMFFAVDLSSFGVAFWFGTNMVHDGSLQPGTVIAVLFSVLCGSLALGQIGTHLAAVGAAQAAAQTILNIIDRIPQIDSYAVGGLKPTSITGRLEFSDVEFSYPTRPDHQVLNRVSFNIELGETVAIVGASGGGKTTIVNLLLRYYDANSGTIMLDGMNIADLNVNYLRNKIGVISQEPVLFDCSIEENILFGRDDLTHDEMVEACRLANAEEFINRLPKGYQTLVGEGGVQLSGGQKQRIAIARAMIKNPAILILDEATSALDAKNEAVVQNSLKKVSQTRTTIIIAHRLSTIRNAHKIIAIKDGTVAEIGSHDDLMVQNGIYKELVESQIFESESQHTEEIEDDFVIDYPMQKISRAIDTHNKIGKDVVKILKEDLRAEGAAESTFLQIVRHSRPEWGLLLIATVLCGFQGALNPVFAVIFVETLNTYTKSAVDILSTARFWSLLFFGLAAVKGFTVLGWAFIYGLAGERMTMRLRYSVFQNVLRQDVAYFDHPSHSTGTICTRLAADAPHVKEAINYRLGSVVSATVSTTVGLVLAFIFGWKMALLASVIFPFIYVVQTMQERYEAVRYKRDAEMLERAGKIATEAVENIRTVQALTLERTIYEMFCRFLERPHRTARRMALIQGFCYAVSVSSNFAVFAVSFRFGAYLIAENQMEPMDVMRVIFATQYATGAIGWASAYLPELLKARSAAGLIFKMLHQHSRIDSSPNIRKNLAIQGNIEFDRVVFAYPSRSSITVLNGLSLKIAAGKTVAIVGQSGCGKSTILRLIERFYDPSDGNILIDGNDLNSMDPSHVRRQIGLVSQEPVLFDSTIKENIAYGLEDDTVDDQKIVEAATLANIHTFISELPAGYETRVGEKGIQLSGGQKQRVAIARALIRNPRMLLLDEATSALDTENEKVVQEALDRAREGRTCIIVAHRLSTVINADSIAVIKNGVVVEQGTHHELVALKGDYYALTQKQNLS